MPPPPETPPSFVQHHASEICWQAHFSTRDVTWWSSCGLEERLEAASGRRSQGSSRGGRRGPDPERRWAKGLAERMIFALGAEGLAFFREISSMHLVFRFAGVDSFRRLFSFLVFWLLRMSRRDAIPKLRSAWYCKPAHAPGLTSHGWPRWPRINKSLFGGEQK